MEIIERMKDEVQEINVKDRIKSGLKAVESFVEDHSEGIMYTIFYGGSAIVFGEGIWYMHLLNKHAKKGEFFVHR